MELAFLLLVHQEPALVGRLVHHLDGEILIHVDAKCDQVPFVLEAPSAAFVEERHAVHYGAYSMVEATLAGMRQAESSSYDYLMLLSGQHYPIKPASRLREYLDLQNGKTIITWHSLPYSGWFNGGLDRIEKWHFGDMPPRFRTQAERLNLLPLRKRRPPGDISIYGGSQWFAMHRDHVSAVLDRVARQPRLVQYFRYTKIPDEMFFQTVLIDEVGIDRVMNQSLTYVDWAEPPRPALLTDSHLPRLATAHEFFARKFDLSTGTLLDRIDSELL